MRGVRRHQCSVAEEQKCRGHTKKAATQAIATAVHQWLNPHTQGAQNRDGRDLRASPDAHLAVPFQKILPWGRPVS